MLFARIIHSALLAAAFVLSSALFAKPAGAAFAVHTEKSREWRWHDERTLHALAVQREGRERLSLEIQLSDQVDLAAADELIWVVPIPAPGAAIHAHESLGVPELNGGSVVGEWVGTMRSLLTVMAGSQIWPCPILIATGWGGTQIERPPWRPPALSAPQTLRGTVEVVPWTNEADLTASLGQRGIVVSAQAAAALTLSAVPVQSLVLLRVTALAQLARAIGAGQDTPVFGLEIEFPSLTSYVPILASLEPAAARSIQVVAEGFVQRRGANDTAFRSDHVLGELDGARALPVPGSYDGRYTALWADTAVAPPDAQLWLIPGASRLTEFAAAWTKTPLRDPLDVGVGLVVFLALSGIACLVVQRVYPLPDTSRRQALLFGFANLLTFAGTLAVVNRYATKRGIPSGRGARFAFLSSLIFTVAVALLAALTACLQP